MRILNLIFFTSLVVSAWCGLIFHKKRIGLHSKLYGHGIQQAPVININNQQQVNQITTNQHVQHGHQGYGSYGQHGGFNGYTGNMFGNAQAVSASSSSSSTLYGGASSSSSASSSSFGVGGSLKPWNNHY